MSLARLRGDLVYSAWVGQMVRGARHKVRSAPPGASQRARWAGLSRGLLDASQLPAWMRLGRPVPTIDAAREEDFYRAGRLWGELLGTCFRERARSGRPLRGPEAEALVEAFSRYTAELAFSRRFGGPLIDTADGHGSLEAIHAAGLEAIRRRGVEPDAETQAVMWRWLETTTVSARAGS